jgi:hypothetical protein
MRERIRSRGREREMGDDREIDMGSGDPARATFVRVPGIYLDRFRQILRGTVIYDRKKKHADSNAVAL